MLKQLKENIANHIDLSAPDLAQFCELFAQKSIKKKEFLLYEGDVCKFEAFVIKGLLRVYHIDANGFDKVLYFAVESWWLTDIDSFTNQTPSQLCIEALEDSELLIISKRNKELAYEAIPAVEKLFRIMRQKTHVALQRRMIDNLSKTADQRYLDFIEKYPKLSQRLTNLQIAAYLGISHEFVSKIRKKGKNLETHLAPNAEWTEAAGFPYAGTYIGIAEISKNVFYRLATEWIDYKFTPEKYIVSDSHIAVIGTYTGTYKITLKAMAARVVHVWELEEGKIVRFEQFVDSKIVVDAMS
ncbi:MULTISPECIES: nuclear transport factor 2 family protein [unclassified Sphingobacterium]|uniref:nuclear transport factor 2 family protein n=1 Tax=unclassified Sphingobacterium TaxID=2609468 RepID=UPI0025F33AF9|nr:MULTISPECIES: nuclear transport factor 2 family protein [unclassified Sphingobacterium]